MIRPVRHGFCLSGAQLPATDTSNGIANSPRDLKAVIIGAGSQWHSKVWLASEPLYLVHWFLGVTQDMKIQLWKTPPLAFVPPSVEFDVLSAKRCSFVASQTTRYVRLLATPTTQNEIA